MIHFGGLYLEGSRDIFKKLDYCDLCEFTFKLVKFLALK